MVVLGGTMELNAEDMDFGKSAKETLTCNLNGEGITIGFKHDAILASLSSVESENVLLQMTDNTRAIVLKDTDVPNKIMLTMPCMLN
jgi:DNA polymerase-3 subunit beta